MTRNELIKTLENATRAIEKYSDSRQMEPAYTEDSELTLVVVNLSYGCYLLLPPRGPTTTLDCPHCTNPIRVTLSK